MVEKEGNPLLNILKVEWRYLGKRKKSFVTYMLFFTIAGIIGLLVPLVMGTIFNTIQQTGISSYSDLKHLIFLISLLLVIEVGFWAFHGSGRIWEGLTGFSVQRNYNNDKIEKVLELPVKWHKDHHSGDTIDKINRGASAISSFSQYTTFSIVYAILNIFGSLIILFFFDKKIALFAFGFSAVVLVILMLVDKKLVKYYKELNKFSNKVMAAIFDYISNIITVITLRLKKTVSKEIDKRIMDMYPTHKKAILINEFKWAFSSVALRVMVVAVLVYRSITEFNSTGTILIGTLYILYGYLERVGNTFFSFAELYNQIVNFDSRLKGADPIDEAYKDVENKSFGDFPSDWKKIDLRNIDFAYDVEGSIKHMCGVSLTINRGQKIALVGESGSGKSTILALLRGLYSPDKGDLLVDEAKIENGFGKLKKEITLIPQDPEIFNNTLKYNITMDLPTKKDELNRVVRMAQFEKVVRRLDKGLNTNVMEKGVSLSGGEKQRLALARGLLAAKDSNILLLDEPTSSVDSVNEVKIHENIFKEFKGKTVISSIHRLHLLHKFDYIYMFEKGRLIAQGSLREIKRNPKFLKIWMKYRNVSE